MAGSGADGKKPARRLLGGGAPAGYEPIPDAPPPSDPEAGAKSEGVAHQPSPITSTSQPNGTPAAANGEHSGGAAPAHVGAAGSGGGGGGKPGGDIVHRAWLPIFWETCVVVWPENRWLQARVILSFVLLMGMRVLNLAVPILYKNLVDSMMSVQQAVDGEEPSDAPRPWLVGGWVSPWVLLYLASLFFQGGAGGGMVGAVNNLRQLLWIPVGQDAYRRISLRIFQHVLSLDLSFHLTRKTGEVTKQIDRGTNAMQNILSTIMFSIVPTCIDVVTACVYLAAALNWTLALTVFIAVGSYIPVTIIITEWRSTLRREMNLTSQRQSARITDALLNWETVQYFTNVDHEVEQYAGAIDAYQRAEFKAMASVNLLNTVQSLIMWAGSTVGLLICAWGVHSGTRTVGDVVLFLSLMAQLYGPLNWFGSFYRTIQQYMIDMENLFDLLDLKSKIVDQPDVKDLIVTEARVTYDNVCFEYEAKAPVLRYVSFEAMGGKTVAFVGATGSGKSTLTRLIFRFYDVTGGAVRVDGQDVRDVSQRSLRSVVGMVPQDTVLFNDTILNNIRYGKLSASDQEVHDVASAACIHEAITTRFPKGYETVVGERGLRLSGGEKQRVAFARALLKNPAILVLDEATSALDTLTERKIQAALAGLRESRTTLIVAHRLSTIVDADLIVVLHLGQVVEQGTHAELLALGGSYHELWTKQLSAATTVDDAVGTTGAGALVPTVAAMAKSGSAASFMTPGTSPPPGTGGFLTAGAGAAQSPGPSTAASPAPRAGGGKKGGGR